MSMLWSHNIEFMMTNMQTQHFCSEKKKRLIWIQTRKTVILSQCATYFLCCQQRWGQEWRPGGLKRQDAEAEEKQKGTARCGKTRGHSVRSSTPAPPYAGGCWTTDGGREVWTRWPWSWSCSQRSRIFRVGQAAAFHHSGQRPAVWRPFTASRLDAQAETAQVGAICWKIWCLPDQVSTSYRKLVLFFFFWESSCDAIPFTILHPNDAHATNQSLLKLSYFVWIVFDWRNGMLLRSEAKPVNTGSTSEGLTRYTVFPVYIYNELCIWILFVICFSGLWPTNLNHLLFFTIFICSSNMCKVVLY